MLNNNFIKIFLRKYVKSKKKFNKRIYCKPIELQIVIEVRSLTLSPHPT